jgi:hypothetical protein
MRERTMSQESENKPARRVDVKELGIAKKVLELAAAPTPDEEDA